MSDQESKPTESGPEKRPPAARETPERRGGEKPSAAPPRPRIVVVFASLMALGVVLFANVGERDFWSESELHVAAVALEARTSGEWVIPRLGGAPELNRPPLVFWLAELARVVSPDADPRWTYRLPVALCALLSLALTAWIGRALFPGRIGFAGMLIQAATFCFFARSTWLGGDLVFATFCQLGLAGFALATRAHQERSLRWALLGWAGLAGAALAKSFLLGPVLVLGSLLLSLFFGGLATTALGGWSRLRALPGSALFMILVLPWYVAVYLREGAATLSAHLPSHLGVVADSMRQTHPAYFHLLGGLALFLPWTFFVPLALYHAKDRLERSGESLCFFAIVFPVVLLSLVPGKEPGDLLVICPYVSLLIAASIQEAGEHYSLWENYLRIGSLWVARVLLVLPLLAIVALAVPLVLDLVVGESWLTLVLTFVLELFGALPAGGEARLWAGVGAPAALAVPLGILTAAALVAFVYSFRLRRRMADKAYGPAIIEMSVVALCLLGATGFFYRDANSLASSRGFVERVKSEVGSASLTLYGARPAAFYYYLSRPPDFIESIKPASGDETAVERLRQLAQRAERVYLAAPREAFDLLRRDYRSLMAMLKEVDRGYLDWSREFVLFSNRP